MPPKAYVIVTRKDGQVFGLFKSEQEARRYILMKLPDTLSNYFTRELQRVTL